MYCGLPNIDGVCPAQHVQWVPNFPLKVISLYSVSLSVSTSALCLILFFHSFMQVFPSICLLSLWFLFVWCNLGDITFSHKTAEKLIVLSLETLSSIDFCCLYITFTMHQFQWDTLEQPLFFCFFFITEKFSDNVRLRFVVKFFQSSGVILVGYNIVTNTDRNNAADCSHLYITSSPNQLHRTAGALNNYSH